MGVEYDGVAGIGIEFTEEMEWMVVRSGAFEEDDWEENKEECFMDLDIEYGIAGNSYTGKKRIYLFVSDENLEEINENKYKFINDLSSCGINILKKDLKIIKDYIVY